MHVAEYISYRSFHAKISDFLDTTIISMSNSVQLNVDIYVVTLYGPYMNVPEKSTYQDYYCQVFRCNVTYEVTYIHDIVECLRMMSYMQKSLNMQPKIYQR